MIKPEILMTDNQQHIAALALLCTKISVLAAENAVAADHKDYINIQLSVKDCEIIIDLLHDEVQIELDLLQEESSGATKQ
jgi:hypothetical protein